MQASSRMQTLFDRHDQELTRKDRLPTVSASQALLSLSDSTSQYVSSGVRALDAILVCDARGNDTSSGGFERGKVTEIWGCNGAGKVSIALQTVASAIEDGGAAVWVDVTDPLSLGRAEAVLSHLSAGSERSESPLVQLHNFTVRTLSHLLAFLARPSPLVFPTNTTVLIITGINALVDLDYPRYQPTTSPRSEHQKWQAGRRYAVLGALSIALNKLAVLNNLAVLVTTNCSMRTRSDAGFGSAVVPGIGGQEWDAGIWTRLVVFRDFHGRFVGVQKCKGKSLISREEIGEAGKIIGCEIDSNGILRAKNARPSTDAAVSIPKLKTSAAPKRPYDEIADSEDDDVDEYGWIATDEHALVMKVLSKIQSSPKEPSSRDER